MILNIFRLFFIATLLISCNIETKKVKVSFDSLGGSEVSSTYAINGKLEEPSDIPQKDGLVFSGWYKDKESKIKFDFTKDAVENEITLYARWTIMMVEIDSEGGVIGLKQEALSKNDLEVIIPALWEKIKIVKINSGAFSSLDKIIKVEIHKGIKEIESEAFTECTSLTEIIMPVGLSSIGERSFVGCSSLFRVVLPRDLSVIPRRLFFMCDKLEDINFPSSLKEIGQGSFAACTSLKQVIIPNGVNEIKASVFSGCKSLVKITLPSGLTSIGFSAFNDCSNLESISIPANIKSIGDEAFNKCVNLNVSMLGVKPPDIVIGSFGLGDLRVKKIKVNNSSLSSYSLSSGWSYYDQVLVAL